jgi:inhibitor of cysteine peptidase
MNRKPFFLLSNFLIAGMLILSACAPIPAAAADPTKGPDPTETPACPSCQATPETLTEQDAGKIISLHVGDILVVALEGNITTGFTWEMAPTENALVALTGEPEYTADADQLGSPGRITLTFKAVSPGQQALKLVYHQPFDKTTPPEKTFEATLVVAGEQGAQPAVATAEATAQPAPAAQTLGEQDEGSTVHLKLGELLLVTLEGNPSTGYTWEVTPADPAVVALQGEPEFKAESDLIGASGKLSLTFKAVAEGQQALTLAYRRPFEKDVAPEKTVTFTVIVGELAPQATPTTVAHPANGWKGWQTYTNASYGFTFQYPPEWKLEETRNTAKSPNTLNGHAVWLIPNSDNDILFQIAFKRTSEDIIIQRSGLGSGDLVAWGKVLFLGAEIQRNVLVAQGRHMTVMYTGPGAIQRGELVFTFNLDYLGANQQASLTDGVEANADAIVASFQLTVGQ